MVIIGTALFAVVLIFGHDDRRACLPRHIVLIFVFIVIRTGAARSGRERMRIDGAERTNVRYVLVRRVMVRGRRSAVRRRRRSIGGIVRHEGMVACRLHLRLFCTTPFSGTLCAWRGFEIDSPVGTKPGVSRWAGLALEETIEGEVVPDGLL